MSRPRSPGVTYAVLTAVLIVLLATVALSQRQPPPPNIAEFAPQSVESITDSPEDQSSSSGTGTGECTAGQNCGAGGADASVAAPTPAAVDVPRVRKCVGDPPRQIEDPQSPPCVPYFAGDNGGATSKGVSRDEIRVVAPAGPQEDLEAFFNKRFEFYGRKLHIIDASEDHPDSTDESQTSAAVAADEQHNAFASMYDSANSGGYAYDRELARRHVIYVRASAYAPSGIQQRNHPYLWQYHMAVDKEFANLGEWACKRLANMSAVHAGDPTLTAKQRKFGVIFDYNPSQEAADTPALLLQELRACGEEATAIYYNNDEDAAAGSANVVLQMRQSGATSVFCLCGILSLNLIHRAATNNGYFPEWMVSSYEFLDYSGVIHTLGPSSEQRTSMFGVSFQPRQLQIESTPSTWAHKEVNPGWVYPGSFLFSSDIYQYQGMLLMASGIQMAGPNLTAHSFAKALQSTRFPNPAHPNMAGKVGFAGGSHTMTIDGTEMWWSESARGPYPDEPSGTWCYVNGGARHAKGGWPQGKSSFFNGTCDSGAV